MRDASVRVIPQRGQRGGGSVCGGEEGTSPGAGPRLPLLRPPRAPAALGASGHPPAAPARPVSPPRPGPALLPPPLIPRKPRRRPAALSTASAPARPLPRRRLAHPAPHPAGRRRHGRRGPPHPPGGLGAAPQPPPGAAPAGGRAARRPPPPHTHTAGPAGRRILKTVRSQGSSM